MAGSWEGSPRGNATPAPSRHRSGAPGARPRAPPPPMNCTTPDRGRCSGGTPPCTPPHMTAHASSYEMHTPARFSYELHRSESGVVREWCSPAHLRRAERGALHRAAGSRRGASGIVRDDGRLAMSISAHAARSISAVGCRKSGWLTTAFCRLSGGRVHVVWCVACT